jgi:hypothetical protein
MSPFGNTTRPSSDSGKLVGGVAGTPPARTITVELTMAISAPADAQPSGLVEISRSVVSAAAELVGSLERAMVGEANVRTARGNAWDAICADRARAQARAEMQQLVRALMAEGPRAAPPSGPVASDPAPRSGASAERASTGDRRPHPAAGQRRAAALSSVSGR